MFHLLTSVHCMFLNTLITFFLITISCCIYTIHTETVHANIVKPLPLPNSHETDFRLLLVFSFAKFFAPTLSHRSRICVSYFALYRQPSNFDSPKSLLHQTALHL